MTKIAVLGTVGVPAAYGGFETLAENLVRFHQANALPGALMVYCSARSYPERPATYMGAELRYIGLNANGASSVAYDMLSLFSAVWRGADVILLLGVSGAVALPWVRLLSGARVVTNIDGVEWKRDKWRGLARWFLRLSEWVAVHFSHVVIADNGGIAAHVQQAYGQPCHVIAYGGDHAIEVPPVAYAGKPLPERYALALCRIEPENNVEMILEAFAAQSDVPLVFVGNWGHSAFARELRERFAGVVGLHLLDPIYDMGVLRTLRSGASVYVHGHSAGGTNPSLVEMMHFGVPVLAFDCIFNRFTTDDNALWFKDAESLRGQLAALSPALAEQVGLDMTRIAKDRYTWRAVGQAYFNLLLKGHM